MNQKPSQGDQTPAHIPETPGTHDEGYEVQEPQQQKYQTAVEALLGVLTEEDDRFIEAELAKVQNASPE